MSHRTPFDQTENARVREALNRYSEEFLSHIDKDATGNSISSPLGAWLLLTQLAAANTFPYSSTELNRYRDALKLPLRDASKTATTLLANIPSAVSAAISSWGQASSLNDDFLNGLTERNVPFHNYIPGKDELDKWAKDNTKDIIQEFPVVPTEDLVFLLATAIATKVDWKTPFETTDLPEGSRWNREHLLFSPAADHHKTFNYDEEGNLYFCLTASAEGLKVTTVVPDAPNLSRATIQAHANKVATGLLPNHLTAPTFTIPDSQSGLYTIVRTEGLKDQVTTALPAWDASSNHELLRMPFPWDMVVGSLAPEGSSGAVNQAYDLDFRQVAKASYHREGFEAAAVTTFMVGRSAMPMTRPVAEVDVTIDRPHAVVATVFERDSIWNNLPVFNAWVEE